MLLLRSPLLLLCAFWPSALQATQGPGSEPVRSPVLRNHVVFMAEGQLESELAGILTEQFHLGEQQILELVIGPREPAPFPALSNTAPPRTIVELEPWVQSSDCLDQARAADSMILRGGSFMDWFELTSPREFRSYLTPVIRGHAKAKKNFLVFGGGCAFLSGGVLVPRERLKRRQRNPRLAPDAPEARVNLSLGPGMMFGSDSWPDSSPLRLLRSMHDNQLKLGAFFVGQVAMDYDRSAQTLRVLGPGHLLLIDLTRARVFPEGLRGGRISSLGSGDHWKVGSAPILMGAQKVHQEPAWPQDSSNGAWKQDPGGADLVQWMEAPRSRQEQRSGPGAVWSLGWDARSLRQATPASTGHRTWVNLPFDCRWPKRP